MARREMGFARWVLPVLLPGALATGAAAQDASAIDAPPAGARESERVVATGDRTIGVDEVVSGVVVVGGDLRVRGEVRGDAVVVNGDLILESTGSILGDALVTDGRLINQGGRIRGEMRTVDTRGDPGLRAEPAGERAAVATGRAREGGTARAERRATGFRASRLARGFAGVVSTVALGLVLAGIGATLVFYGRPYLENVSDTVRGATVRSGATGLAASFLVIPAFVVLIVALAVSIIGIPFLLVAVPLYPLALVGAAVFGLLGVCHAIGERTAEQSRDGFDFRYRNSYAYLFTGLGMLMMPLVAAHLITMTGFLGFIGTLLKVVTWLAIWFASTIGFGAVILSRAGTQRTFAGPTLDALETDDFFGDEPVGRTSSV
jgi:hypothetical protein